MTKEIKGVQVRVLRCGGCGTDGGYISYADVHVQSRLRWLEMQLQIF